MEPNHYRRELISLRIAVARIAQQLRVETEQLPVLGMQFSRLDQLAKTHESGWNLLCLEITDKLLEQSLAVSRLAVSKPCVSTNEGNQDVSATQTTPHDQPPAASNP